MRKISTLGLCLILTCSAFAGCIGGDDEHHHDFNGIEYDPASPAPDFTLTDQNGQLVSLSDFEDKVVVIAFTYTICPDVCLAIEANLDAIDEAMPGEEDLVILSITIDPARDTPSRLLEWTNQMGYDWPHLTSANHSELEHVWHDYSLLVDNDHINSNHEAPHQLAVLYPDNTTAMMEGGQTGWNFTEATMSMNNISLNYSTHEVYGHSVNGINGIDSPSDWSWWWSLHIWNETSEAWESSPVGIDSLIMGQDTEHIAWAASNANASLLASPEENGGHHLAVLYPDNTTAMMEGGQTGWNFTEATMSMNNISLNYSTHEVYGHSVNGINGIDSPSDWSWWWSLHIWNETSEAWESSPVGIDSLMMGQDTEHIAWAASNANLSLLPQPSEHSHDGDHGGHSMEGELYEVGHNTVTFVIDKEGMKRLVFTGSDWLVADFIEDLEYLVHHDSGADHSDHSDHSGHDH